LPIVSLLLLVLVARALVPVGFMPAGNGSAQLMLCPDGMLMPDAGSPGGAPNSGHLHVDHCPFGSAPFAAPISELPISPERAASISIPGFDSSPWIPSVRGSPSHQPRAPPA
jgi:hypothetical protein